MATRTTSSSNATTGTPAPAPAPVPTVAPASPAQPQPASSSPAPAPAPAPAASPSREFVRYPNVSDKLAYAARVAKSLHAQGAVDEWVVTEKVKCIHSCCRSACAPPVHLCGLATSSAAPGKHRRRYSTCPGSRSHRSMASSFQPSSTPTKSGSRAGMASSCGMSPTTASKR